MNWRTVEWKPYSPPREEGNIAEPQHDSQFIHAFFAAPSPREGEDYLHPTFDKFGAAIRSWIGLCSDPKRHRLPRIMKFAQAVFALILVSIPASAQLGEPANDLGV